MKILVTILFSALLLFLLQPVNAAKTKSICTNCCSSQKKNNKESSSANSCNPFVNCCYRTFEVVHFIVIKEIEVNSGKQIFRTLCSEELKDFSFPFWHPPQSLVY